MDIKTLIRTEATRIGFHKVGVARSGPVSHWPAFDRWLQQGCHGEMQWLAKNRRKRRDPALLFPDVKSVVSLAVGYHSTPTEPFRSRIGKVARYARGADYHRVLKKMLKTLLRTLKDFRPDINGTVHVDTAPVLEKYWALQCGIGWMGKHSLMIAEGLGSRFFLAEILLNVEMKPDTPATGGCGRCRQCLDACPAGALCAPYTLDARKCRAYLTVEHRGPFPPGFKSVAPEWVWGCDICQDVCPWNRHLIPPLPQVFTPHPTRFDIDRQTLLAMNEADYQAHFHGTSLQRSTKAQLLRNIGS